PQYLLTALSLGEDGDLDISDERSEGRYRPFHEAPLPVQAAMLPGGRRVSPHDPLLPVLLAVPVALGGWVGAKVSMALMTGALAALLAWTAVCRLEVPLTTALLVVATFALSPPLAVYGTQVYPELPAALAVAAAITALTGPLGAAGVTGLGAAVVALPWLAVKYVPVAAVLALLGLARMKKRGDPLLVVPFASAMAVAGAIYLAAHQALYGGWTPYAAGDHFAGGEWGAIGFTPDLWGRSTRLMGLLMDRTFGLAAWQPGYLLLVPAVAALLRRRPAGWKALALPLGAGWLAATFLALTMHGWWWPGRQVVVVLPAAVLAVAWWAGRLPRVRPWLLLALLVGSASYAFLLVEGVLGRLTWVVAFEETSNPLYRAWRLLLPDYRGGGRSTWVLHAVWIGLLGLLANPPAVQWVWASLRHLLGSPNSFQEASHDQPPCAHRGGPASALRRLRTR
ncbi:MAG: hypothetical protein M3N51_09050, partial [Actinomycetota bacterium]|nr:hypothetical protein [Actinomycetota bacterium]